MKTPGVLDIAGRLMAHAAAPFFESAVRAEVLSICHENDLSVRTDRFGNALVEVRRGAKVRPLVLAAHMDHPGFEIFEQTNDRTFVARFNGGVPIDYFKPGTRVRLQPGNHPAKLVEVRGGGPVANRRFALGTASSPTVPPEFAVWDLTPFRRAGDRVTGRACDDLIGVAAVLASLIQARRARFATHLIGAITRAEEVGFGGALALAAQRRNGLPADGLVISLETSRELPPVKMGRGVIVRVGDRSSVFDSTATRLLQERAAELEKRGPTGFIWQKALMSGGSCEGTVYQEYGFQTAAVCVALGNYHNCGPDGRIAAEHVSGRDVETMVNLLTATARGMRRYPEVSAKLFKRLEKLRVQHERRLLR